MTEFKHIPILLSEIISCLSIKPGGTYVDCTIGGAGHSFEIAKKLNDEGLLIGIDKDLDAIKASKEKLKIFKNATFVNDDFKNLKDILTELNIKHIDGCLIDLGVSSYQLDSAERGFSFRFDSPLDMRMNQNQKLSAYDVVNKYPAEKLIFILKEYGEEKFASSIVKNIIRARETLPIKTTKDLCAIIEKSFPIKLVKTSNVYQKTFQAIRIEVNGELEKLRDILEYIISVLKPGGRLCVLSFHSLEDRIVKNVFKDYSINCICPPDFPICVCGHKASIKLINSKPIIAGEIEQKNNPRSQCAKLRVAEKL